MLKRMFLAFFACLFFALGSGVAAACTADKIDVTGNGSQCETVKFTLTTTNLAANASFNIWTSAKGTFYIDCGDGGTLSGTNTSGKKLNKTTNLVSEVRCEWSTAGAHTIRFGGVATEYASVGLSASSTNSAIQFGTSTNQQKIAAISGSLGALFPQLGSSENQIPRFTSTFDGASNLASIPGTLFSGLTGGANAKYMFYETFADCTSLTIIPAGLFGSITNASNSMFYKTFDGCSNLSSFIPSTTFAGLTASNSPTATGMWTDTFNGTQLVTSCPSGTLQYTTGYESNWNSKVSCICTGTNFLDNTSNTCIACPSGYDANATNGKTNADQCQRSCAAGTFVATPATVGSTAYTRLEYIENPNGKLINTGFSHSTTATTIRGVLRVGVSTDLPNNSNVNFIGNQASGGGYSVGWNAYFKLWTVSSNSRLEGPAYAMTAGTVHQIEYEVTNNTRKLVYDDGREKSDTFKGGKILSPATTIHLFDAGNNQAARSFKGRIYDLQVYEDDVLVHNFVAARRNSDSKIGMYDIVTDTFLEGSGTFTAGPDAGGCSNVGIGYYSNASLTNYGSTGTRLMCTNGPAHSHYTGSAASNSCPYDCDANYVTENGVCEFQDKFTVTTTSDTTELRFGMSAVGVFYVDCGTDGTLTQIEYSGDNNAAGTVITRTNTQKQTYSCTWPTAGVHTVKFAGLATSYNTTTTMPAISFYNTSDNTSNKIASMTGSLSAIFPQKGSTNGQTPRFYQTFRGATNLTSIPAGLFTGITGNTNASNMFRETFYGCTSINTIPAGLFTGVTTGATEMFRDTFTGCTSLTAIPSDLFSGVTTAASGLFQATFKGATNLTSYIPPTTFAGLIANNSPTATDMWTETFRNTNVFTVCPVDMDDYITNYESEWDSHVSCYVPCPATPPANSAWSIVNGVCEWLCDAEYYSADSTSCTAVGDGFYSPDGDNTRTACTNKPVNSHYTGSATTDNCPWQCDTGYGSENGVCRACNASEFFANGVCETAKFTITTTNSTSEFKFFMWEPTGTFYVDWGDGTVDTITRTSSTGNTYSHTYATTGSYTINFGGVATGYDGNWAHTAISFYQQTGGTQDKIASVSGSLAALFPTPNNSALPFFRETFKGATNLTSVPNTLFSGITRTQGHMFYHTFDGAGLTAIPYDLFSDIDSLGIGMFEHTFANCTSLTAIPGGLFDDMTASGATDNMFEGTFMGCTSLASIPVGLFDDVIDSSSNWTRLSSTSTGGVFRDTFNGCTSLTSVPAELFSGMTISGIPYVFANTFRDCSSLATIPSGLFDDITISGTVSNMFESTFEGCTSLTAMPAGLFSDITTVAENLFYGTFSGCTNLAGYIPPSTFAGLISNDSTKNTDMWGDTFAGTGLVTLCPAGTTQYITGYEGSTNGTTWNGKVSCEPCAAGTYKSSVGNMACTACEIGTYAADTGATACTACTNSKPANSVYTTNAVTNACLWACDAGYYSTNNTSCVAVGNGFYSAAGDNTRTACDTGLTTIGYGHGADEANDCGHIYHVGDYVIYTRSNKVTTPSLNFLTADGDRFYINVSPTDHTLSRLHIWNGTQKYTAYDDSLLYHERPAPVGD